MVKTLGRVLLAASMAIPMLVRAEPILDRVEVVETEAEAQIHIEFITQVRYLRHFPTDEAERVQIFLDLPQLRQGIPLEREFRTVPPSDVIPGFSVNFPEPGTNSLAIRFSKPVKFRISPSNNGRGIVLHIPMADLVAKPKVEVEELETAAPQPEPIPIEVPEIPAGMSVEEYTAKLMGDARAAMGLGDYAKATQLLNAVLNLPPHQHSQEALELVGQAREKNGELTKAKAEYELYLKLYPQSANVPQVKQRLSDVEAAIKLASEKKTREKRPVREVYDNQIYGNWNQYYYDVHTNTKGQGIDTRTHDQSSLISNLDITGRFRRNEYDNRLVFRDTHLLNLLPGEDNENRNQVRAAYFETENRQLGYMARLGRQTGNYGGILGRFDGALLRYALTPRYRINFVAGVLDERDVSYRRNFYGVNLDIGPFAEKWSGNLYYIQQKVDDVVERRAVGAELRYFDVNKYFYSLLDYDTIYKEVNIASFQGNWLTESGINFNLLVDHRKVPLLQLINGLFAVSNPPPNSVREALRLVSREQLRDFSQAQTADSDLILFGITKQMNTRWQLGGDIRLNRTSGLDAAGIIPARPETGTIWTYTLQAIGQDTLFKDDTSVIIGSYAESATNRASGPTSKIYSLVMSNYVVPRERWRISSSLRLSHLSSDPEIITNTVAPVVRVSYQLRERMAVEAEFGLEHIRTRNEIGSTRSLIETFFLGYRWDF